jgi:hypothetical protein
VPLYRGTRFPGWTTVADDHKRTAWWLRFAGLPQRNSNADAPDRLTVAGSQPSRPGSAPGPGEPGYSQDVRRDLGHAWEQHTREAEARIVAGHSQSTGNRSLADLTYTGILVLCAAVVEFAVLRYIEGIPEWLVGVSAVAAIVMAAVVASRARLSALHPKLVPVALIVLFLIYLVPIGYAISARQTAGQKWEYHWVDLQQPGDWGGHDIGCTLSNTPSVSYCDESVNGRYAVCWDRSPTSPSEACPDEMIQKRVLCTYKDRNFTLANPQPSGPNPGFLFRCLRVQVK